MHTVKHVFVLLALLQLAGCSYWFGDEGKFRERSMDYQLAENSAPLAMPDGVESVPLQQRYPIPDVPTGEHYTPNDTDSVPRPHSLLNVDAYAGVELREDGGKLWLQVQKPRYETFSLVNSFATSSEYSVAVTDRDSGIIETTWLEPRPLESNQGFWRRIGRFFSGGDKDKKEKYRFLVTAQASGADSRIVISHIKVKQPAPEPVEWAAQDVANEESQEALSLVYNELMDFLGESGRRVGASVLSHDSQSLPKYTMTWDGNGFPVLVMNQDFNHAWLDVGKALADSKLPVTDLDRSLGVYFLDANKLKAAGYEVEVDLEKDVQVRLASSESGIQVSVQLDDETVVSKELSSAILNRLRENLEQWNSRR